MPYKVKRKAGSKSEITCKLLFSSSDITIVVTSLCVCDFEEVRRQAPRGFDCVDLFFGGTLSPERVWVISIARLRTLLPVYLRPIDVIVFDGPCVEILS